MAFHESEVFCLVFGVEYEYVIARTLSCELIFDFISNPIFIFFLLSFKQNETPNVFVYHNL